MNILDEIAEFIGEYNNPVLNLLMMNLVELEKNNVNQLVELSSEVLDFIEKCKLLQFSEDLAEEIIKILECLPTIFMYYFFQHLNIHNSRLVSDFLGYLLNMQQASVVLSRYSAIEKAVMLSSLLSTEMLMQVETVFEG